MSTNPSTAADREERLKSALWFSIGTYIDDQCLSSSLNATPQFIGALTELVYTQIANTARDLETFSQHAGRSVVRSEDVMLLTRRNDALEQMLRAEEDRISKKEGKASGKMRKRGKGKGRT